MIARFALRLRLAAIDLLLWIVISILPPRPLCDELLDAIAYYAFRSALEADAELKLTKARISRDGWTRPR